MGPDSLPQDSVEVINIENIVPLFWKSGYSYEEY